MNNCRVLAFVIVTLALAACSAGQPPTDPYAIKLAATATPIIVATPVSDSSPTSVPSTGAPATSTRTATPIAAATPTFEPSLTSTPVITLDTPAATATPSCYGSLGGTVFDDVNQNNAVDAGEAGLRGAVIELKDSSGSIIAFYTTGNGQFTFPGLAAGSYTLRFAPPANYVANAEGSIPVKLECFATVTQNFLAHSTLATTPTPSASANLVPDREPQFGPVKPDAPTYFVSQCSNLAAPGTYLLTVNLVSQWDCIQIKSDWVVLDCQGHSLDGTDYNGYGVSVHQLGFPFTRAPQNIEIRNCKSSKHRYGIYVDAGTNIYIHNNQIIGNFNDVDPRGYGQFLGLPEGGGIRANSLNNGRIEDNVTTFNAIGIDIRSSKNTFVRHNTASNNTAWGIHFYATMNSEISSNTAKDNVRYCTWGNGTVGAGCDAGGVMLQAGSSFNTIKNNEILSGNGNGIFIKAHDEPCGNSNTLAYNHISNVLYNGIEASFCKDNEIIGNEIDHALDGIWLGFARSTRTHGGNKLHDLNNHGYISWNSQDNVVSDNSFANDREAIYLFSSDYKQEEFFFVPGTPSDHIAQGNYFGGNTLTDNSAAAVHFSNAIHNQVRNNTFRNNVKNFLFDGNTTGNIIEDNTLSGGAYLFGVRHLAVPLGATQPTFLRLLSNANNASFDAARLYAALAFSESDSFDLRWFKLKMRLSFFNELYRSAEAENQALP